MIYDCFLFSDEIELLELRLRILDPVVDKFVLVEAPHTMVGTEKNLVFAENKDQFARYSSKIIHVVVDDLPLPNEHRTPMQVEHFQRNAMIRGFTGIPSESAIMVSDVDEIPHPTAVMHHRHGHGLIGFPMTLYYYYVNCRQEQLWWGTVMASAKTQLSPQDMREERANCSIRAKELGWHFSFLGGVDRIQKKLASFSESQVNTPENADSNHLRRCLETGYDMFHRNDAMFQKKFVPIDETYPSCIRSWLKKYPQMCKEI